VRWCEKMRNFGGVFIGENDSICYNNINMVKKHVKFGKKTCGLNVEKLITVQKTCVFSFNHHQRA